MTVAAPPRTRRTGLRVTGVQAGIVLALVGVGLGAFFEVRPPDAYGVCMACHGRDLANSVVNSVLGTRLTVAPASLVFPVLTVIGVLIGAFTAAVVSGEFRWRKPSRPARSFIYGVVVMNAALLAAACSIRLLLRTAAGDIVGLVGFLAMAAGVVLATVWLRRQALR